MGGEMINYGFFGNTFSDAVSDSVPDAPFGIAGANAVSINDFIVVSDVNIHIQRNGDADASLSPFIPAGTPVQISLYGPDTLSYITAAGASDGSIWITAIS